MSESTDWSWATEPAFIVSTTIAVASILAAVILYFRGKQPKRLDYTVRQDIAIWSPVDRNGNKKLEVSYEGNELKRPRAMILRFTNTGKQPLVATDFHLPITLRAMNGKLKSFEVIETPEDAFSDPEPLSDEPEELVMIQPIDDLGKVTITPKLLNSGHTMDVQLIIDGGNELSVTSLIVGQTRDMKRFAGGVKPKLDKGAFFKSLALLTLGVIGFILILTQSDGNGWWIPVLAGSVGLSFIGATGVALSIFEWVSKQLMLR